MAQVPQVPQPPPPSIFDSFNQTLPGYRYTHGLKRAPQSGSKSKQTKPPIFAVRRLANRWCDQGDNLIHNYQLSAHPLFPDLLTERLYNPENAIVHRNEADVVRTAAMYLIHPVCQALHVDPSATGRFASQAEDDSADGLRTDITYYKSIPGGSRAFAIVEFKRRTVIREKELNDAIKTFDPNGHNNARIRQDILNNVPAISQAGQTHRSYFLAGSHRLLRQASAYAIEHRTRYVALFDYDHLVCIYFPELDHRQPTASLVTANGGVGDYAELDVYPFSDSHLMRKALLGFLEDAYTNTPH